LPLVRAFQIANGVGAGNIGDELMARTFWQTLPQDIHLTVPLLSESSRQHEPYPQQHEYIPVDFAGNENSSADCPGLLVGDTPVAENEGLDWPLRFLAPRLEHFHRRSAPVDAVGVGVDRLTGSEALQLFRRSFLPIRSWTVRSRNCRDALLAMGVDAARIKVGADWAWLHQPKNNSREWAENTWSALDIDARAPLLVINPVNMIWRDARVKRALASAFDAARRALGFQIAFFCNECREGDFFDFAAVREIQGLMSQPSAVVPPEYYSPDEAIALISFADVTVAQRYHFAIESIFAKTVPVCVIRGQKMASLADELGLLRAGTVDHVESEVLLAAIGDALQNKIQWQRRLASGKRRLAERAAHNLDLLWTLPPYNSVAPARGIFQIAARNMRRLISRSPTQ
jgi:polysaccharide pyruvyl transferase WcaK-like protein